MYFVFFYKIYIDLTKYFEEYITFNDPKDTGSNISKRKSKKLRYK
jgi:hypothetical protein